MPCQTDRHDTDPIHDHGRPAGGIRLLPQGAERKGPLYPDAGSGDQGDAGSRVEAVRTRPATSAGSETGSDKPARPRTRIVEAEKPRRR